MKGKVLLIHKYARRLLLMACLLASAGYAYAQQRQVNGTVKDETGQPLPGANIVVKGTTTGTTSNFDGSYQLMVESPESVLVFSFVGYQSQEIVVGNQTTIDVQLAMDLGTLSEIVVTGYASERKADLTGAVSVVELTPIKNNATGNPMQALQGRVAGLYIEKNGGAPNGENSRILIRGSNTLGNTDPLYIIDGVPTKRPEVFQSLAPGSIESIQVLKDASAASIYGSRASNGVIIVTTKDGKSQTGERLTLTLNSNVSILTEKPQRINMLSSEDRGRALWRGSVNDRTEPNSALYTFDWNGNFDNPELYSVTVNPFVGGDPLVPAGNTDWQDESYQTAYVTTNDLTIAGGTPNSSLLVNIGHVKNSGMLVYTNYERFSARINANVSLFNSKLKFGMNSEVATSKERLAANDLGGTAVPALAVTLAPTIPVYRTDGVFAGPLGAGYSDRNNPVHMQYINQWDNVGKSFVFGNVYAEAELFKNLFVRSSLGVDFSNMQSKNIELAFQEGFLGRSVNSLHRLTNNQLSLTWSNTARYQLVKGKSTFNFLAGIEAISHDLDEFGAYREGFSSQSPDFFYLDAGTGRTTVSGRGTGSRLLSQFGKINFSFDEKYLASLTLRRDGSSRFGEENKYGFFPAATLGWRIVNEPFMKNAEFVSDLKLRAGLGRVGNQDIGDVARFGLFEPRYGTISGAYTNIGTAYDLAGNDTGILPSGFVSVQGANLGLKWESTTELNLGIDFGFMNDRLYGSLDYFTRETTDILIRPPIASAIGEGQLRWVNGATKENKGFELVLGYRGEFNGITYNVTGNLARFRDKITELPEEVRTAYPGNVEKTIVGHSQYSLFGYRTAGLFQTQEEVDAHANQVGKGIGRIKYVDLNNDGQINALDQDWLGTTLPAFEYGVRIDLAYKNFDLSIFGSGIAGRSGADPTATLHNRLTVNQNNAVSVLDAWTPQNPTSKRPMLSLVDANNEGRSSDYFIVNTSYFKMRNIQLGYTLPEGSLKVISVESLRLYVMGENLFWFKSDEFLGPDPERTSLNQIPVPTSVTFGLNVTF
jgi:TonB-linked SusC/RagA family outer membrane protein